MSINRKRRRHLSKQSGKPLRPWRRRYKGDIEVAKLTSFLDANKFGIAHHIESIGFVLFDYAGMERATRFK